MQEKSAQIGTIGHRIREFCNHKYLSINDFAVALGMDAGNVQSYMRGARKPGAKVLSRLESLGCNTSWILTGKGEMLSGGNPAEKQLENGRSTLGKEGGGAEVSILDLLPERLLQALKDYEKRENVYMMPAMGPQMTPEKIKEGDVLMIDPNQKAIEGDWILVSTDTGPSIQRHDPSATSLGVVIKLIREPAILRR